MPRVGFVDKNEIILYSFSRSLMEKAVFSMTDYETLAALLREQGMDYKRTEMFVKKPWGRRFLESKGLFSANGEGFYRAYLQSQE